MSESLGLSIGVANLVAARVGGTPVARTSVLTLFDDRPSEVGLPEENPALTQPGLVLRGFIERIGERTPLVAADGTKYLGEALTVDALEAMARTAGYGTPVTVAVPAYWSKGQFAALREEFFAQPGLSADGVAPVLVSDATAALAALSAAPGFPAGGVVAVCDFGAGGTTVTLTDAGSNLQQIGASVRYTDFSGDAIDQLIANHLRATAPDPSDLANTARTGSLNRQLGESRRAKEELSTAPTATIATVSGDILLSRNDFEQLITQPLDRFIDTIEEVLQRNGIPRANLAAVATVGGGASIPLVPARLSERLQVPILTTARPAFSAAIGASLIGLQSSAGAATAAAPVVAETPTELVGTPPTQVTPTAPAAPAPVAWSEDTSTGEEPVPYTGPEHTGGYGQEAMVFDDGGDDRYAAEPGPLPWYKRTALVVSVGAALAAVLLAVVLALTLGNDKGTQPSQTPQTVTITAPNGSTTVSVIPPSPPDSSSTESPATTTTGQAPSTTTTSQAPTTTTTTAAPTTTTTQPPTTSSSQATTTAPTTPTRERPTLFPHPFEPPRR